MKKLCLHSVNGLWLLLLFCSSLAQQPVKLYNKGTKLTLQPNTFLYLNGDYTHQAPYDATIDEKEFDHFGQLKISGSIANETQTKLFKQLFIDISEENQDIVARLGLTIGDGDTTKALQAYYDQLGKVVFVEADSQSVSGNVYFVNLELNKSDAILYIHDSLQVEYTTSIQQGNIYLQDALLELGDFDNANTARDIGILHGENHTNRITGTANSTIITRRSIVPATTDSFGNIGTIIKSGFSSAATFGIHRKHGASPQTGDGSILRGYEIDVNNPAGEQLDSIALAFLEPETTAFTKSDLGLWFSSTDGVFWRNYYHTDLDTLGTTQYYAIGTGIPLADNCTDCNQLTIANLLCANPPQPDLGDSIQFLCVGDSVVVRPQAALNGFEFQWEKLGSNDLANYQLDSLVIKSTGKYVLTAIDNKGCIGYDTVEIQLKQLPIADFNVNTISCIGDSLLFINQSLDPISHAGDGDPLSYQWSFNDPTTTTDTSTVPSPEYAYAKSGIYFPSIEVSNRYGCTSTYVDTVYIYPSVLPQIEVIPSACEGDEITFQNNTIKPSNISADNDTLTIAVGVNYQWTISTNNGTILHQWSNTEKNDTSFSFAKGDYIVSLTTNTIGANCSDSTATTFEVRPLPEVNFTTVGTTCESEGVNLSIQNLSSYDVNDLSFTWNIQGEANELVGTNPGWTPSFAGDYEITLTSEINGCIFDTVKTVAIYAFPDPNFSITGAFCPTEELSFTNLTDTSSLSNVSYLWSFGDGNTSNLVGPNHTYATNSLREKEYTISLQADYQGCQASQDQLISIHNPPMADFILSANEICAGESVLASATTNFLSSDHYEWQVSGRNTIFDQGEVALDFDTAGVYNIVLTAYSDESCDSTTLVKQVTVHEIPEVAFTAEPIFVCGDSLELDAGFLSGASYNWSTGSSDQSIIIKSTDYYEVSITSSEGCIATKGVSVDINETGSRTINAGSFSVCGDTTLIAPTPNASYTWYKNDILIPSATEETYGATESGVYKVVSSVLGTCDITKITDITLLSSPDISHLSSEYVLCANTVPLVLDAQNTGYNYSWTDGTTTSTNQQLTVNTSGNWNLTVSNAGICEASKNIRVTVEAIPSPNLGSDTLICEGEFIVLTAGSAYANESIYSYSWSTGETSFAISASPGASYSVTVTNTTLGCSGSDDILIGRYSKPSIDLGADRQLCAGQSVTLDAAFAASTYQWSTGSTDQSIVASNSGTYWVNVTSSNGCQTFDDVAVNISNPIAIDLGPDQTLCSEDPLVLSTPYTGFYQWESSLGDNITTPTFEVDTSGKYWVTVTDLNGCSGSDTINILFSSIQVNANFFVASEVQTNDLVKFVNTSYPSPLNYEWAFGNGVRDTTSSPSFQYPDTGSYTIVLSASNGFCTDTKSKTIKVSEGADTIVLRKQELLVIYDLNLYPNPTEGEMNLYVDMSREVTVSLSVMGVSGITLYTEEIRAKKHTFEFDFYNLPLGIYYLKVLMGNELKVIRFLKI